MMLDAFAQRRVGHHQENAADAECQDEKVHHQFSPIAETAG